MYFSLFQLLLFLRSARATPNVRQIPGVARADVTATLVVVTSILCTVTTEAIVYQVWRTLFMFIYHLLCNLIHLYFCFNPQCQSAVYRVYSLYKSWYRNLTKMYKAKVQRGSLENIWIYSCLLKKSRLGNHLFTNEDQLIVLTYVSVLVFPWLGEKRYLLFQLS